MAGKKPKRARKSSASPDPPDVATAAAALEASQSDVDTAAAALVTARAATETARGNEYEAQQTLDAYVVIRDAASVVFSQAVAVALAPP